MIARVTSVSDDGERVSAVIQYLDDTDPLNLKELDVHQFTWEATAIGQQIRADIIAWGKTLGERVADINRIRSALEVGSTISI